MNICVFKSCNVVYVDAHFMEYFQAFNAFKQKLSILSRPTKAKSEGVTANGFKRMGYS